MDPQIKCTPCCVARRRKEKSSDHPGFAASDFLSNDVVHVPAVSFWWAGVVHHSSPSRLLTDFDSPRPFSPPPWTTVDDRLRNGSSQSFLIVLPNNCALFYGHLDVATLGGAGFAARYSPVMVKDHDGCTLAPESPNGTAPKGVGDTRWNLNSYSGLEVRVGKGDGKLYTLVLKDSENSQRKGEGRDEANLSWEAKFRGHDSRSEADEKWEGEVEKKSHGVRLLWKDFQPTYRGRESHGKERLDPSKITTVGIMMRSYFGSQEGDFRLEVESIAVWKVSGKKEGYEGEMTGSSCGL